MAAASGLGFQLRLLRIRSRLVWVGVAVALAWVITDAVTNAAVDGVYRLDAGLWYANAGPLAWLDAGLDHHHRDARVRVDVACRAPRQALGRAPPAPVDACSRSLVTYSGLVDVTLAWHVGVFPLGWLLSGVGSVLVVRALIFEDLLRVRAVDDTAPRVLLHLVLAVLLGWVSLALLGPAAARGGPPRS